MMAEVAEHAATIAERWPSPSPTWLPRTQERLEVPLCGGRIVLAGVVDLVLGQARTGPGLGVPGRAQVGRPASRAPRATSTSTRCSRRCAAAPRPFRIATYYSGTGELDAEPRGRGHTGERAVARPGRGHPALSSRGRRRAGAHTQSSLRVVCGTPRLCTGPAACRHRCAAGRGRPPRRPIRGQRDRGSFQGAMADRRARGAAGRGLSAGELARVRGRGLVRDLQALSAELPAGERLQIDAFKVLGAQRHPERCMASDDTFVASPRLCRRALGVAAVNRCVRGLSPLSGRGRDRGAGGGARGRRRREHRGGSQGALVGRVVHGAPARAAGPWWLRRPSRGRHSCLRRWTGGGSPLLPSSGGATTGGSVRAGQRSF